MGTQRSYQGVEANPEDSREPCQSCEKRNDLLRFVFRMMMTLEVVWNKLGHWLILGISFS